MQSLIPDITTILNDLSKIAGFTNSSAFLGNIEYQWSIDFKYSAFQKLLKKWKDKQRTEEKETFLKGKKVKELLEFCQEPKSYSELHAFMCERKEFSYSYFRKLVIRPLIKKGKLKFTISEDVMNRHQRYTSI